jgi:hypothetical protein
MTREVIAGRTAGPIDERIPARMAVATVGVGNVPRFLRQKLRRWGSRSEEMLGNDGGRRAANRLRALGSSSTAYEDRPDDTGRNRVSHRGLD